jgi:D-alanine-D-alanine ligase
MTKPVRVLLLFGGRSAEHDVSCVSAVSVARALDPQRYEVIPVGITTDGQWRLSNDARALLAKGGADLPERFAVEGELVELRPDPTRPELVPTEGGPAITVDVVFPILHGPYGEDGTVQGLLELAGLPYVGSGVLGSAVGMDKVMMKRAFIGAGLPVAPYRAFREHEWTPDLGDALVAELGLPLFVKPANMGSSVGISKVKSRADLDAAVAHALAFDEDLVVEAMVPGREIEIAVLGDREIAASVAGEIIPGDEFYSYTDKYESDAAQLIAPAALSAAELELAQHLAVQAFVATGCVGMARVDFLYDDRPEGVGFVVNEVNTIPGFTSISMFPKLWGLSGVAYPELCERLIAIARDRHARRVARAGRQRWE